ncbi:hypothetical protein, partial [Streptomyces regalis]|uniref:hypothetical protein n=1 Tax=Streptomyces regalis TaxID=68262 RepID=UPI001ABEF218
TGDLGREPVYQELRRCAGQSNSRSDTASLQRAQSQLPSLPWIGTADNGQGASSAVPLEAQWLEADYVPQVSRAMGLILEIICFAHVPS